MQAGMIESRFEGHQRVNDILLGRLERKLLAWFCARLPAWITPDVLTLVAFLAGMMIAISYALTNLSRSFLWVCSLGLALHWFGDSLDGSLARYRKIERPRYGYYIDHSLDTLVGVLIALGIGASPFVRFDCVFLALIAYLMMSVSASITACVTGVFQISYGKLGPTELRVAIIVANTIFFFAENPVVGYLHGPITFCDLIAIAIATFLILAFIGTTLRTARKLRRSDDSDRICGK
jgi:archaetidylinositol phosphate synthase